MLIPTDPSAHPVAGRCRQFIYGLIGTALLGIILVRADTATAATPVQRVLSPGGIEAWLIESHDIGIISMKFSFEGGALEDPPDKPGVAYFASYLFNEGAGALDTDQLTRRRNRIGVQFYASAEHTYLHASFSTPSAHRASAFEMLRSAIQQPRFDAEPIAQARRAAEAALTAELTAPDSIAGKQFIRKLFGENRLSVPVMGALATLPLITRQDIEDYRRRNFARSNLKIAVAGDITPDELGPLLDTLFGDLPGKVDIKPYPPLPQSEKSNELLRMEIPQTIILLGNVAPKLTWHQAMAFDLANQVLSGGMTSRLFREVREKRGLVYAIAANRYDTAGVSVFMSNFGAGAENAQPALEVTRTEVARFLAEGPTEEEVRAAKSAFLGSFFLGLDTNDKLVTQVLYMLRRELPITYLDDYAGELERISLSDVITAARAAIRLDRTSTIAIGAPPLSFQMDAPIVVPAAKN